MANTYVEYHFDLSSYASDSTPSVTLPSLPESLISLPTSLCGGSLLQTRKERESMFVLDIEAGSGGKKEMIARGLEGLIRMRNVSNTIREWL
jgi:hypothetical protein